MSFESPSEYKWGPEFGFDNRTLDLILFYIFAI